MYPAYNEESLSLHCSVRTFLPKELHNVPGLPDLLIYAKHEGHLEKLCEGRGNALDVFEAARLLLISRFLTCQTTNVWFR